MSMFTTEKARELLRQAGLFYEDDGLDQTLNQNDTWCWAGAFGQDVQDDELPRLAEMFWRYGWCGVVWWVSEQNDGMRSEFYDINRFVEFVAEEEAIREKIPSSSQRAYYETSYCLHGTRRKD